MDIRKIKKLIELAEETGIAEIEIKEGEESVRICRRQDTVPYIQTIPYNVQSPQPQVAHTPHLPESKGHKEKNEPVHEGHIVCSPMVGTMYKAPSPDAKPFVQIGDHVNKGDTLCIVEAMKMMNQIEADQAGIITAILVDNGQAVEFGQPLFVIKED